jgi:hypothetical protein
MRIPSSSVCYITLTSSILLIPWYYNELNNAKLCIVTGSDCANAPNCYQKKQKLNPYFKAYENVEINAVKPFAAVWHSVKPFVRGSHSVSSITFRSIVGILWTDRVAIWVITAVG